MESSNKKTYAQQLILAKIAEKEKQAEENQKWDEYEESYGFDYHDSHSDYYDSAEGELAFIEKIKQEKMLINDAKKNNKIKNMIQKIMNYVKIKTK
jgi:tRNA uridine 5-carbamoylmethylation protein Kti12